MKFKKLVHDILVWRIRHISNKNFIFILSFLLGIIGGLAAVTLKSVVFGIHYLLEHVVTKDSAQYLYFLFPLIGILLTVAYKVIFLNGKLGHGIPNLLYTMQKKSSLVEQDKMYSHVVSSSLTVGFGGSVGLEAPIVTTGAAFGSNMGRVFHLGSKKRTLLIGCGAAAAIGGIFNSPVAGVIFSLEVLMLELSIPAFIPLLIASATSTITTKLILGGEILFNFSPTDTFHLVEIPFYVLLGIILGMVSLYFTRMSFTAEQAILKIPNVYTRALLGGAALGLMIFIFPPLYGEGYYVLKDLLIENPSVILERSLFSHMGGNDIFLLIFAFCLILVKVFASSFTIGAGGNGGVFAPAFFVGGITGFFVSKFINVMNLLPFELSNKNFVLVGMAGAMSGILHAPLTAIFLIAEITGGYVLILPLMIVSAISYATISYFEPHPLYAKQLALKGHFYYHNKDKTVLTMLKLNRLIERDLIPVNVEGTLGDLVTAVSKSKRNIFPVINSEKELKGIIVLDDIREIMFKPKMYDTVKIQDLMRSPSATVSYNETMEEVMKKFDSTSDWNLPVIDDGKYIGFLSKSKIFSHYRHLLIHQAREDVRIID